VKQQLHTALQELKSARTIISLLQDDIKKANAQATNNQRPSPTPSNVYAQEGDKWIPVVHKGTQKPKTPMVTSMRTEQTNISSNRFTLLANLNENQTDGARLMCNSEWSTSTKSAKNSTIQPSASNKISTIINGRVRNEHFKKPTEIIVNSSRVPDNKNNKLDHKVKIIGDSQLKGITAKINQYLNTKFEVSSLIKPGAHMNQLVHTQEMELQCLGRKDIIVINGGTNDINNVSSKRNKISVMMTQFIQKYNNTNIVVVNIPHRYDLAKDSRTNLEIQAYNDKLNKMAKSFKHVAIAEIESNRKYFTKHGLHLNNAGKEWLAKLLVTQISKLINSRNKTDPVIALNWKNDSNHESINITVTHRTSLLTTEEKPSTQIHNNQDNRSENEALIRTSNRQKKAPVTRSKDFLWQM
jgi:hypothetical protein